MDEFDLYATQLPKFNFEGRKKIGSPVGIILSGIVFTLVFTVSLIKFTDMVSNRNPNISEMQEYNVFMNNETAMEVANKNFTIAFQVSDYTSQKALDDPAMVRWYVQFVERNGNDFDNELIQVVGTHICTQEDKEKFFPPRRDSKQTIDKLFKANTMYCLD